MVPCIKKFLPWFREDEYLEIIDTLPSPDFELFKCLLNDVLTPLEAYDSFLIRFPDFVHNSIQINQNTHFVEWSPLSAVLYATRNWPFITYPQWSGDPSQFRRAQLYYVEIAAKLIRAGHCVHHKLFDGWDHGISYIFLTPIPEMIALFIRSGLSIEQTDIEGQTPLYNACHDGDVQKVHLLLRLGANPYNAPYPVSHLIMTGPSMVASQNVVDHYKHTFEINKILRKACETRNRENVSLFSLLLPLIYIHQS